MLDADFVVVGAGAAGLAAAQTLSGEGRTVVVIEARERAGGRMLSVDVPGIPVVAELGPEFVHGEPHVTLWRLAAAGDAVVDNGDEGWHRGPDGLESGGAHWDVTHDVLAHALELPKDCTVDELLERARARGVAEDDLAMARALVAGFDAADPARASAKAIAEEWCGDAAAGGVQTRPLRGYGAFARYLLQSLDPNIVLVRFATLATRVTSDDGGVTVTVSCDGVESEVRANAAIVTVPLGVLEATSGIGAIVFDPPLPPEIVQARGALAMGPVYKVVLIFADPFWEKLEGGKYREAAFISGGEHFTTFWTQTPIHAALLTAWAGGPLAAAMQANSAEERRAFALHDLGNLVGIPDAAERCIDSFEHDWQADPLTRGAYTYALVHAGNAREALGRPFGRVVIAGEATALHGEGGTVAGALQSGERAANALLSLGY